jgi:hypothetical protein
MSVQLPAPAPTNQPQVNQFTARPVEVREPAARPITRTAVSSAREALEHREDRSNRAEQTRNDRADRTREARSAPRDGRGANVDIDA